MSRTSFYVDKRKAWKRQLLALVQAHPEATIPKIKGLMSLQTGLSHKRIQVYLEELEEAGLINIDGDKVAIVKEVV